MINIKRIAFTTLISFTSISASASNTNDVNIQVPVNDLSQSSIITDKAHDKNCKKLARKAVWRGIGAAFGVGILATTDNSEEADWSVKSVSNDHAHRTDGSISYNETYGQRHDEALINGSFQTANAIQTEGEFELAGCSRAYLYPKSMQASIREREAQEAKHAEK